MPTTDGSSRNGSRKRMKLSRDNTTAASMNTASKNVPATTAAPVGFTPAGSLPRDDEPPCHHEEALKSLHTDMDAMRQLVTCQICHRFMYEPYALSCGHTYCYSCLAQWLPNNRKKTCPDCRTHITQQPTPSYVIREMVLIFIGRSSLLPDGETSEEHSATAKEEAEIVAKDKANADQRTGGLFKGCFSHGRPMFALHDPGDGVDRCPQCHWEMEDGLCEHCGLDVHGFAGHDFDSDVDSIETGDDPDPEVDDFEDEDDFYNRSSDADDRRSVDSGVVRRALGPNSENAVADYQSRFRELVGRNDARNADVRAEDARRRPRPIDWTSDTESDGDDDLDEHDSDVQFIDDDDEGLDNGEGSESEGSVTDDTEVQEVSSQPPPRQQRRTHVVISDDEDVARPPARAMTVDLTSDSDPTSDPDSDDDAPVLRGSQSNARQPLAARKRQPVVVPSDEDEDEDSDPDDHYDDDEVPASFSPPDYGSHEALHATSTDIHAQTDDDDLDSDSSSEDDDFDHRPDPQQMHRSVRNPTRDPDPATDDQLRDHYHRLQTFQRHRDRFTDASATTNNVASPSRQIGSLASIRDAQRQPRLRHPSLPPFRRHQPLPPFRLPVPNNNNNTSRASGSTSTHPFQLDDTLARIRNNTNATRDGVNSNAGSRQPVVSRTGNLGQASAPSSTTASSAASSPGGVDVPGPGSSSLPNGSAVAVNDRSKEHRALPGRRDGGSQNAPSGRRPVLRYRIGD